MKGDAKSISFVEDTAVAPERLRDYIERFLADRFARTAPSAGVYAHASVGCLHVRPVVNLKTEAGVRQFEAIANDSADLVLEFGGALSGEHGDGLVRSPFMEKMFGPELYEAFRHDQADVRSRRPVQPRQDRRRAAADERTCATARPIDAASRRPSSTTPSTAACAGAVEMCSGLGVCRKTLDGTMCPSYMATRDEAHSTRGRANVLRLAMAGQLGEAGLGDDGVREVLDLCLECRACKAECPVGVDVARFKSEFLADYWRAPRHAAAARACSATCTSWRAGAAGSRRCRTRSPRSAPVRWLNERLLGLDRRRVPPAWAVDDLRGAVSRAVRPNPAGATRPPSRSSTTRSPTTTIPAIGMAGAEVLRRARLRRRARANGCCGRPLISQGLLDEARRRPQRQRRPAVSASPSGDGRSSSSSRAACRRCARTRRRCCAATTQQRAQRSPTRDAVRGVPRATRAQAASGRCRSPRARRGSCCTATVTRRRWAWSRRPARLLARIPARTVIDLDAGCCGMAGSFGYARDHFDVSRAIGERRLLPAARGIDAGSRAGRERRVVPAPGRRFRRRPRLAPRRAPRVAARRRLAFIQRILHESRRHLRRRARRRHHRQLRQPLNVGVLAIAMAWIVGVYIGGLPVNTVMGGFPSQLFLTLAGVTLLFALAQSNGTLDRLTHHAVRICRGNRGMIPIMFFVLGAALSSMGPGNIATAALLAPMAMATAVRVGIPLFLMAIMVGNGANAGALSPFAPTGIIVNGLMARNEMPGLELQTYLYNLAAHALVAFGGLRALRRPQAVRRRPHGRRGVDRRGARRRVRRGATGSRSAVIAALILSVIVFGASTSAWARSSAPSILVAATRGGRRRGDQADAVAGDRDGVRRHRADRARREGAGHRSARVAGGADRDAATP